MGNLFTESIRSTYTTMFLVPSLGIDRELLREMGFIDGYLDDVSRDVHYSNAIYMLFKPPDYGKFNIFTENERTRTTRLVDDYDYEGGWAVLVYLIEERFLPDYQLFMESRYSRFSEPFKSTIPRITRVESAGRRMDVLSIPFRVMSRHPDLIEYWEDKMGVTFTDDMELLPAVNMSREVLDIDEIKSR